MVWPGRSVVTTFVALVFVVSACVDSVEVEAPTPDDCLRAHAHVIELQLGSGDAVDPATREQLEDHRQILDRSLRERALATCSTHSLDNVRCLIAAPDLDAARRCGEQSE